MKITPKQLKDIERDTLSKYPEEACGLIVAGKYIPCINVHPDPLNAFKIDPAQVIKHDGKIEAVFHSHPYDPTDASPFEYDNKPEWPSESDQKQWIKGNEVWIITATDGSGISDLTIMDDNDRPPLLGRAFEWFTSDCYTLLKDYYQERLGITLKHHVRKWAWWKDPDADMFVDLLEDTGFKMISAEDAAVNDICLFKDGSNKINHVGIISGQNELMQIYFTHTGGPTSVSHVTRLDKFARYISFYARYYPKKGKRVKNS